MLCVFLPEDPESCHWTVDRRYHDFYTLESKLTEFHGDFPDTQLPPKRILFGPRGVEFMESKRQVFRLISYLYTMAQPCNVKLSQVKKCLSASCT
jgi:sorting nexin-14